MSRSWMRFVIAGTILFPMTWASRAQSTTPQGAWLMQNYRFTGPPPPREVKPVDSFLMELRGIQATIRNILSQAKFEGDYGTALAAAEQLVANAQLIGAINEQQQAPPPPQAQFTKPAAEDAQSAAPFVLIALKDKTINAAKSYWVDGPMLNYITLQGSHVIVRLNLVDPALSRDLNRQRNVEFRLPE
jgi:hypothetical protein